MPSIKSIINKVLPKCKWKLQKKEDSVSFDRAETFSGVWKLHLLEPQPPPYSNPEICIASFELREQLNCCGIMVLSDLIVTGNFQRKGLGRALINVAAEMAMLDGYSAMLVTFMEKHYLDDSCTIPINKLFGKGKFKKIHFFLNHRTNNTVGISIMKIRKRKTKD